MNQIYQYLPSSNVIFLSSMQHTTKKRAFEEASLVFQMSGVPHTTVFDALFARERLGNNSLGGGVCLPHCRLEGIERPMAAIVLLHRPIPIDPIPIDTKPVDIFFFLVVPETGNDEDYLDLLRESITMLEDRQFCNRLRRSENPMEVCACVMNWVPPNSLVIESQDEKLSQEWEQLNEEVEAEAEHEEAVEETDIPAVAAVETESVHRS